MHVTDDLGQELSANLGTLIGYILVGGAALLAPRLRDWFERRRARQALKKAVVNNVLIQDALVEARNALDCDRLTVSQFHNGDHFASGASVQKLTLSHYTVRPGVTGPTDPVSSQELRATPASFMPLLLDELFRVGYRVCRDFDTQDPWVQRYQAANGLRTVVLCLIPGKQRGEAYGIMGFCWLDLTEPSESQIALCLNNARRIALYL